MTCKLTDNMIILMTDHDHEHGIVCMHAVLKLCVQPCEVLTCARVKFPGARARACRYSLRGSVIAVAFEGRGG